MKGPIQVVLSHPMPFFMNVLCVSSTEGRTDFDYLEDQGHHKNSVYPEAPVHPMRQARGAPVR